MNETKTGTCHIGSKMNAILILKLDTMYLLMCASLKQHGKIPFQTFFFSCTQTFYVKKLVNLEV